MKAPGDSAFKSAGPERLRRRYGKHRKRYLDLNWLSLMSQIVEACLVAEASGSRYVLIGNERSANEENGVRVGDLEVNHQYVKCHAFEREFAPFLATTLHPELRYASLLMPFYEVQIARIFASYPQYLTAFRSCNRRTPDRPWCLECPKCAFVFLMLSAFLYEEAIRQVFRADLLADPALVKTFLDLCGRAGHKPLECVGHQEESLLALHLASNRRTTPLHPELEVILPGDEKADQLQRRFLTTYKEENGLPTAGNEELRRTVAASTPGTG